MPASMAETTAPGTIRISRPKTPVSPIRAITTPETTKAPITSPYAYEPMLVTRSAAPGVDQAVITGIRVRRLRAMQVRPLPIEIAQIQEPVRAASRCAAWAADSTMTSGPE